MAQSTNTGFLSNYKFTANDALLLTDEDGKVLYEWRADQQMVPASLVKIITSWAAIEQWGLSHQFVTEFYQSDNELWIKGYGDPYVVSEELDSISNALLAYDLSHLNILNIDSSFFDKVLVPGRSSVTDPYNAPLGAVAANFNTVSLRRQSGELVSAESQTPITQTATHLATSINELDKTHQITNAVRVNLREPALAQRHFAELLIAKTGLAFNQVKVDQKLPANAELLYRHRNSNNLRTVISGSMLYSNNFIANQVFLKLAEWSRDKSVNFELAEMSMRERLSQHFDWQGATIIEGAGLSRENRLSAKQIDDVLLKLKPYQQLFKRYQLKSNAIAYAKTGTLNGVSNFAGYLNIGERKYRFVFMFNRQVPYGYRDQVLNDLAVELANSQLRVEKN